MLPLTLINPMRSTESLSVLVTDMIPSTSIFFAFRLWDSYNRTSSDGIITHKSGVGRKLLRESWKPWQITRNSFDDEQFLEPRPDPRVIRALWIFPGADTSWCRNNVLHIGLASWIPIVWIIVHQSISLWADLLDINMWSIHYRELETIMCDCLHLSVCIGGGAHQRSHVCWAWHWSPRTRCRFNPQTSKRSWRETSMCNFPLAIA